MPPGKPNTTFQTVTLPGGSEENHGRHVLYETLGQDGKPPPTVKELPDLNAIFGEDVAAGSAFGAEPTAIPIDVNEFGQPIYHPRRLKGPER